MRVESRIEIDSIGERAIPRDSLYGSNTSRALENFPLTGRTLADETEFVSALALIKKAAALANAELGLLSPETSGAIIQACDEMEAGLLNPHLPVPILEGSGGTSINMNVNEVLCNRALQIIGKNPGEYDVIHPNDSVNCGQSTSDVIPSALNLACLRLADGVQSSIEAVYAALEEKEREFAEVLRVGRTCLQEAQPMTLGQAFGGYAAVIKRAANSLEAQKHRLLFIPLGGTAIGTGLGAESGFKRLVFSHLRKLTNSDIMPIGNSFDGIQNLDELQRLSGELQVATGAMAKIAKDFIILSSGPNSGIAEIKLPSVQPGSSIMPGKVNPVIPMSVIQLAQIVHGNHASVSIAAGEGMLEINHYDLLIASRLFESLHLTAEIARTFADLCIAGIAADSERSLENLMKSNALATTLVPKLGYSVVSNIVKESVEKGRPFLELAFELGHIEKAEVMSILRSSTNPNQE